MTLKLCRWSQLFALGLILASVRSQGQSMCNPVSNNPLVMQELCSAAPKAEAIPATLKMSLPRQAPNLQPISSHTINHMTLTDAPVVSRGDVLVYEANRSDFIFELFFANGKEIVVEPLTRADAENTEIHWKHGETKLDYPETMNQRIVRMRLRAFHQLETPLLLRGVKLTRSGEVLLELQVTYQGPGQPFDPPMSYPQDPMIPNPHMTNISVSRSDFLGHQPDTGFLAPRVPSISPTMFQSTTTSTGDPNHYKFQGKELDAETGLYNFGARYYNPALSRYMSPDFSARPTTVPYANLNDPQTLNLYSFGRNNPMSMRDSDGHCPGDDCNKVKVTVTAPAVNVVENQPAGNQYHTGVGTTTTVTFTDKKGHALPGLNVSESPKTKDNLTGQPVPSKQNPGQVATSPQGTIKDNVTGTLRVDSQPHEVTPEDIQAVKDGANSLPYNRTTDQTLTFDYGKSSCQCTYSETLSNVDSNGNLNTKSNENGLNFTFSTTTPVTKRVEPTKDKDQK